MKKKEIVDYILNWLNIYLKKSNLKGFLVGVSGGVDSAVVSTLLAKTCNPVLLLNLPIHQNINQFNRSNEQIDFLKSKFLKIESLEIDLSNFFNFFCENLHSFKKNKNSNNIDLVLANTKSRLRMIVLYYYAGIYEYLVTGTGNKVEDLGVGFFTKYGDGGVDINPIGGLTKSQVFILADFLGIPSSIKEAKPTDGLWLDNRTDEDQLGLSYNDIEWAMKKINNGLDLLEVFESKKRDIIDKYLKLHKKAKHKINPIPICNIPSKYF